MPFDVDASDSRFVQEWRRAKNGTERFIVAVREADMTFRPKEQMLTFAGQFCHIAYVNYVHASVARGCPNPADATPMSSADYLRVATTEKDALLTHVMNSYDYVIHTVLSCVQSLDELVQFHSLRIQKRWLLFKTFEHQAHHRGQAAVYFRLCGCVPPREGLYE